MIRPANNIKSKETHNAVLIISSDEQEPFGGLVSPIFRPHNLPGSQWYSQWLQTSTDSIRCVCPSTIQMTELDLALPGNAAADCVK